MAHPLTLATFHELADVRDDPCISLFLQATRRGNALETDLRFRKLLEKVEQKLKAMRMKKREIEDLLRKPRKLLEDHLFWQIPGKGYAIFCSPTYFAAYHLPGSCEEHLMIAETFAVAPLLPMLPAGRGTFFVLALSQKGVRLLEESGSGTRALLRQEWPGGIREALGEEKQEKLLQGHTVRAGGGEGASVLHGQGGWKDMHKKNILEFLLKIEKDVAKALCRARAPLVFIGVDALFGEYRKIQHYPALLLEAVRGSPDRLSDRELVMHAKKLLQRLMAA